MSPVSAAARSCPRAYRMTTVGNSGFWPQKVRASRRAREAVVKPSRHRVGLREAHPEDGKAVPRQVFQAVDAFEKTLHVAEALRRRTEARHSSLGPAANGWPHPRPAPDRTCAGTPHSGGLPPLHRYPYPSSCVGRSSSGATVNLLRAGHHREGVVMACNQGSNASANFTSRHTRGVVSGSS